MSEDFEALWNEAGGPTIDTGDVVNALVWQNLRVFHDSGVEAGFTDDQVWEVSKEVMLAAILPSLIGRAAGLEDDE